MSIALGVGSVMRGAYDDGDAAGPAATIAVTMTDRPSTPTQHPTAPPDLDAYLARFDWHPEPELIGYRDEGASRDALERLGERTWRGGLDYLYEQAIDRAMGDPSPYAEARRRFYAPSDGRPAPAPRDPTPAADVLAEFAARLGRRPDERQHPRQFGYFTPPPLPMSIMGELLAQVANQGVDVWHAGPFAAFVEEEVVRWLCDLVGYDERGFGLLTSGGVMANFMAMTLARDLHLGRLRGLGGPPRGRDLEGARVYTSDQTHFSIARALDELGFPPETLVVLPADDDFHLRGAAVAAAVARDRAAGLTPFAIAAVAGSTNTGTVDADRRAGRRRRGARTCGSTSTRPTAARRGCRRATPAASRTSTAPTRSRSIRTSGSSRPTTSAGCSSATGRTSRRSSAAGRPSTTAAARRRSAGGRARPTTCGAATTATDHGDQLNFYKLSFEGTRRWRALKLWMSWKHLGTTGFGRLIEANDDLAAHLARRCAEADDFEALPAEPELSVVCFRHVPAGAARRRRRRSTPTRTDCRPRSRRRATAG